MWQEGHTSALFQTHTRYTNLKHFIKKDNWETRLCEIIIWKPELYQHMIISTRISCGKLQALLLVHQYLTPLKIKESLECNFFLKCHINPQSLEDNSSILLGPWWRWLHQLVVHVHHPYEQSRNQHVLQISLCNKCCRLLWLKYTFFNLTFEVLNSFDPQFQSGVFVTYKNSLWVLLERRHCPHVIHSFLYSFV